MKYLLILFLLISSEALAQYPGGRQYLGNDSNVIDTRGAMMGRFINKVFTDTTQANTQRIKYYDGAQIYTKSGGGKLWIRDSTANKWKEIGAGGLTVIKEADTLRYTIATNYAADPAGTIGSALKIQNALDAAVTLGYNACYLPPGSYKIEDTALVIPDGVTFFGIGGDESRLITTTNGSTASLASAMNIIKMPNARGTVKNICLVGNGRTTYTFPWTSQNGIWVYGQKNTILNCTFKNLKGTAILGIESGLGATHYNAAYGNRIDSCTVGYFMYAGSEYWNIVGGTVHGCAVGVNEWGANNSYNGVTFTYCTINGRFAGNGANSDHSYVNNCIFNHATTANLDIDNIALALTFTGGGSWGQVSTIDQSVGVSFSNFQWGSAANVTVTAATTDKATYFVNNLFSSTSVIESGTGKGAIIGPSTSSSTAYSMMGASVGIGTATPAKVFHTVGTVRHVSLGTASGDTTTYKPLGISSAGDVFPMTYWPGGGGSSDAWLNTGNAFGSAKKLGNTDNFGFDIVTNNTVRMNILNTGEVGIGVAANATWRMRVHSAGNGSGTYNQVWENGNSEFLLLCNDAGDINFGNSTTQTNTNTFYGTQKFTAKSFAGGTGAPTALLHIAAGTTAASTAPEKFTSGPINTTAEAGAKEYNGSHYQTNSSLVRYAQGGTVANTLLTGQTTTPVTVATYTAPADGGYFVSATLNITAIGGAAINIQIDYTDETSTPVTMIMAAPTAVGHYSPPGMLINAKSGTTISVYTVASGPSRTFNIRAVIQYVEAL